MSLKEVEKQLDYTRITKAKLIDEIEEKTAHNKRIEPKLKEIQSRNSKAKAELKALRDEISRLSGKPVECDSDSCSEHEDVTYEFIDIPFVR